MFFVLLCFLFTVFLTPKAEAAENFTTAYAMTYNIEETGNTNVTLRITLTNTTTRYFASGYKIQVGFDNIENITATDVGGSITPAVNRTDEGNQISVNFSEDVLGQGKKQVLTINFDTPDIAKKQGNIWEINIPGITDQEKFTSLTAEVTVPESFGTPTYSKPKITGNTVRFTKKELGTAGISIGYGGKQVYSFTLYYHLKNRNLFPVQTEIALPPSTNYQDVFIDSIIPKPLNVEKDRDGNWLAKYRLSPSEKIDITVKGKAQLSLTPKMQPETEEKLNVYLKPQPYWQVEHSKIQRLAKELKTPEAIYRFVVDTLTYDFSRVSKNQSRLGAVGALEKPESAVCLEFTDLFVTLARAAGIPAREVNGFAYTQNVRQRPLSLVNDILHSWPEYYDREKQTWIMVDPTWGNTTGGVDYFRELDLDHFAFVIKGSDSDYPVPAGGYKVSGEEERKDVHVTFDDTSEEVEQKLSVLPKVARTYMGGFAVEGALRVENVGRTMTAPDKIRLTSGDLTPKTGEIRFASIPPYGYVEVPFSFAGTKFLTNAMPEFTIHIQDKEITQSVTVSPFFIDFDLIMHNYIYGVYTITVLIAAYAAWRLRVLGRTK